MRIPRSLVAAALAACSFLTPVRAQMQVFGGPDEDRQASTLIFADMSGGNFAPKGALSISYSQPDWKESYNKVLESGKFNGSNQRLGKNWWTSLDTMIALDIGGTKIAPGNYYLGIHVDDKGAFHLMVIDARKALLSGWAPFMPEPWKAEAMVPLTMNKDAHDEVQKKMLIAVTADEGNPNKGKFSIRWGKHELSADVKFMLGGPQNASSDK